MARFDVYELSGAGLLVVDVQADLLSRLDSRVVVPLLPAEQAGSQAMPRLVPLIRLNGSEYRLMTPDISGVSAANLKTSVGTVADQHHVVVDAIDFMMQGF